MSELSRHLLPTGSAAARCNTSQLAQLNLCVTAAPQQQSSCTRFKEGEFLPTMLCELLKEPLKLMLQN